MINSRKIDDLDPAARLVCQRHIELCRLNGIELLVTSTYRDYPAQDELYAIGRTKDLDRKPVTKAMAGKSFHNYRCAWDVVPIVAGKPVWKANDALWLQVIHYGKEAGAEAGAEWKTFKDLPHFQLVPKVDNLPITLAIARARFDASGTIFTA